MIAFDPIYIVCSLPVCAVLNPALIDLRVHSATIRSSQRRLPQMARPRITLKLSPLKNEDAP